MASRAIAAIITNYNMPERTEALVEHIRENSRWPVELFVVDNGSDLIEPAESTTLWLEKNMQTTGGWLAGLEQAKEKRQDWLGYWFLITSAEFCEKKDTAAKLAGLLMENEKAVCVHPALTQDSTTAWRHMIARIPPSSSPLKGGEKARQTWMVDNIASLWRAEWFDEQGGFDPEMAYGWGIDLDLCWKARRQGRSIWIHEGCQVKKVTDIGYAMQRMNMTADERRRLAGANMDSVLLQKYGAEWNWKMREEFVTDEIR